MTIPTTEMLDAELRDRGRPAFGDYRPEALRWRERERRRWQREHLDLFLSDDEIDRALTALQTGDERTFRWVERIALRRVSADVSGRRRQRPGAYVPDTGHDRCMQEATLGADPTCACVEWFLIGKRDGRFPDPWSIHVHRERVREERRKRREAPPRDVTPLLPGGKALEAARRARAMPVPVTEGRAALGGLRVIDGGRATASAADARLPDLDLDPRHERRRR